MSNFAPVVRILIWIMFATSLVAVAVSVAVIAGARIPILEIMPGQAHVLLFAGSLVAVFSVLMATVHYTVTQTHLRLNLAFVDILGGRIRLENILNIVLKTDTDGKKPQRKMYISYIWKGNDPVIAQIGIAERNFGKMKDVLMRANPNIVFFDEDKTNQDETSDR